MQPTPDAGAAAKGAFVQSETVPAILPTLGTTAGLEATVPVATLLAKAVAMSEVRESERCSAPVRLDFGVGPPLRGSGFWSRWLQGRHLGHRQIDIVQVQADPACNAS